MKLHARPRSAFTLLELLVVLGIMALLASITVSAVFRLQSGQKESNTNTHLTKIQMALDQQWKPAAEQFRKEAIPEALKPYTVNSIGSQDPARARALHVKLKLRQQFPQTFREVRLLPTDFKNEAGQIDPGLYAAYGPQQRQSLTAALGASTNPPDTNVESAILLYLSLSQWRGGAVQNPDQIARTDLINYADKQYRVFVDEWGNPICFRRWALDIEMVSTTSPIATELNSPPFVAANAVNRDPDDPDGKLKAAAAPGPNDWNPYKRNAVQTWFTLPLVNPANNNKPDVADPLDGNNRGPFILSAGKDGKIAVPNDPNYPNGVNNPHNADNLYSFRLQQFRKGN